MTADTKQIVRPQPDIDVQVAVGSAALAGAALAGHTQALLVRRAFRNADFDALLRAPQLTVLGDFSRCNRNLELGPARHLFDAQMHGHLEILAGPPKRATGPVTAESAAPHLGQQIE